ncbi:hypothetical protein [Hippea alviniae]|uniref:hypothetical protein n=1 Tax=Hippea alviniae TaxID=1279027 RepID=UPI0003B4037B|nr:hypothetical protein [Hippea alviniae]
MRRLKIIVVIVVVFIFQVNSFALSSKEVKKYAWEAVKYELHNELNKRLGTDIPVENILQAIDHMSHGEFDKAKQVISEEVASQVLGILVGSAGASVIGVAWNFTKSVYGQMIKFNEKTDILHFKRDFLKEQVESWKVSKSVPKWKDFIARVNAWFDDRIGNSELGRSVPYAYRKKYYEQLRSKIWAEALLIHTRYRRYFYAIDKAKRAAERAKREIYQKVANLQMHYDIISWRLKAAKEPVNERTLNRYDNDETYRKLVDTVWTINSSLPKDKEITIATYISLLKTLNKANRRYIAKAYSALVSAEIPATEQNVRLFILNDKFRSRVIEEASKKKREWEKLIKSRDTEKIAKSIKNKILNVKGVEYSELIEGLNGEIDSKLKRTIKDAQKKTEKVIEMESKGISPSKVLFFEPYIEFERRLANDYISESISFSTFISYSESAYKSAQNYYRTYRSTQLDVKNWDKFKSDFRSILNMVRNKRADAMNKLEKIKESICKRDNIPDVVKSEVKKLKNDRSLNDVEIYQIERSAEEFKELMESKHKITFEALKKRIEIYEKLRRKLEHDVELYSKAVEDFSRYIEDFYKDEIELISDYNSKQVELSNFIDNFGAKYIFSKMSGDEDEMVYSDKRMVSSCEPKVKKHYMRAESILSNMEDRSFKLAFLYQQLLDYIGFLKTQQNLNERVYNMTFFNYCKIVKNINSIDKRLGEAEDKAGKINAILFKLYLKYGENFEIISSEIMPRQKSLKIAMSRIDKRFYKPLSFYESELKSAERVFANCLSVEKRRANKYKEFIWYFGMVNSTFSRIKLITEEAEDAVYRFESCMRGLYKPNLGYCDWVKSNVFKNAYNLLYKLKRVEKQLYDILSQGVEKNPYEFSIALDKAKVLPFKPFFDIAIYERMLNDFNDKHPACGAMRIKALYVNGRRVFRSLMITSNNLTNQGYLTINGDYEAYGNNRKCRVKTVGFLVDGRFKKCKIDGKGHFVCDFYPTKNKSFYVLKFSIKNYANYKGDGTYILITYKRKFSSLERFLNDFENTYNSGKSIDKFFARGSNTTDVLVKIANENRSNFKHRLVFYPFTVVNFKSFERSGRFWSATIRLPWRVDGDINRKGVAIVKIVNCFNIQSTRTFFIIDQIEGDSFLSPFKISNNKKNNDKNGRVKIAVLSHAKSTKWVGYSLDFETGKYSNREMDIAAGFVNPKVKGYDKPYFNVGMIRDMGRVSLGNVKVCPKSGYSDYYAHTLAKVGHTYCVRTQEGHYAKLEVIKTGGTGFKAFIRFKWVYGGGSNRF